MSLLNVTLGFYLLTKWESWRKYLAIHLDAKAESRIFFCPAQLSSVTVVNLSFSSSLMTQDWLLLDPTMVSKDESDP